MRKGNLDRRFTEVMVGLILIIAGLSAVVGDSTISLVLGVIGLYLLARQFDRGTFSPRRSVDEARFGREDDGDEYAEHVPAQPAQPRADQVYAHALDAVRRAGLDPAETHVLPVDIGVMTFSGDQEPTIFRTRPVLDDIDYLQPFVQLRLPTRAHGRVRFEIIDSDGQTLFIHEDDHEFERGRNLVTPAARLPIHDAQAMHGDWHLRVSADGVLIAEHDFGWEESTSTVIRRHLREDGELSSEVRAMVAESRLQRMSLDELLSEQGEADASTSEPRRQQAQRR